MAPHSMDSEEPAPEEELEEEQEDGDQIEDWDDWRSDEDDPTPDYLCLFCDSRFDSADTLFHHCASAHSFDFRSIVRGAGLDFYCSFKLINYIRSQVAANKCWSCGIAFQCKKDLQIHLHAAVNYQKDGKYLWEDDMYLKPFLLDDTLLHGFLTDDDDDDEDDMMLINKEELMIDIMNNKDLVEICNDNPTIMDVATSSHGNIVDHFEKTIANNNAIKDEDEGEGEGPLHLKQKNKQLRVSFANVSRKEIKKVNDNYFGAYGQYGIHREMISDKVRTDTYREAILKNPSLMNRATVMDVGCGTGILSLFAAQAGASRVFAVEASVKMASVATQIVKDNGLLVEEGQKGSEKQCSGVINVVHGMVEELDKVAHVLPHTIDVLVSEWMGYCLLYESMLCSVIYARDHWLKPGGAILPDTASIFVAGFGRGGTSLPFWENVYGFDMSCIGKEVVEDSARAPIVDVIESRDLVTESVVLQCFDLATMKVDEMDFTANCELELKADLLGSTEAKSRTSWCHGIALWFETGFTSRFCKETPTVLSTSPYSPSTHWSQTIFTFQEPIAMTLSKSTADLAATVGTERCPAARIRSRISIARSSAHRSIDISLETTGISSDGRKHSWPAQIFNL